MAATSDTEPLQAELERRQRAAALTVAGFLALAIVLLLIAYFAGTSIFRPGDPAITMGLWIAILIFGLGAFVLRRTKFAALRLKDITAVQGPSALLQTLQTTTIQCASIGGAIALMGFMITIRTGEWTNMLRSAGVSLIVLIYCYPFRSAWERTLIQLSPQA